MANIEKQIEKAAADAVNRRQSQAATQLLQWLRTLEEGTHQKISSPAMSRYIADMFQELEQGFRRMGEQGYARQNPHYVVMNAMDGEIPNQWLKTEVNRIAKGILEAGKDKHE